MNSKQLRAWLKSNGLTLKDLSKGTGINYDRLVHITGGFRAANDNEAAKLDKFMQGAA